MNFPLIFKSKERSRDSRSSKISYKLEDKKLSKIANYHGARAKPSSHSEVELNSQQIEQLATIIEKLALNEDYEKSLCSKSFWNNHPD